MQTREHVQVFVDHRITLCGGHAVEIGLAVHHLHHDRAEVINPAEMPGDRDSALLENPVKCHLMREGEDLCVDPRAADHHVERRAVPLTAHEPGWAPTRLPAHVGNRHPQMPGGGIRNLGDRRNHHGPPL